MRKVMLCFGLCAALLLCCACESTEERMDRAFKSIDLGIVEATPEDRLETVKEYRSKHTRLTVLCNKVLLDGEVSAQEYTDALDLAKELGF